MSRSRVVALIAVGSALACLPVFAADSAQKAEGSTVSASDTPTVNDINDDPRKMQILQVVQRRIIQGFPDGTYRPHAPISEEGFAKVIERLLLVCPVAAEPGFQVKDPDRDISRLRALTVLLRAYVDKAAIESIVDPKNTLSMYGDSADIPAWGLKYAAFAVDNSYMVTDGRFRPNEPITRSELAGVVARCMTKSGDTVSIALPGYTGLVVDCRGLGLRRSMCPSLVCESGGKVYPDCKNLPTPDFIENRGLAAYARNIEESNRLGVRPLEIKAVRADGSGKQIAVISDADRDKILSEDKNSHFLEGWNVTFLID
jgi:hypothetical protein